MTLLFPILFLTLEATTEEFANPQQVEIEGYHDDAMEPFISRDGQYLFFNNRNEPPEKTDLFYAKKTTDHKFRFRGEIQGINSPALDAVASMDNANRLYFVSLREYKTTYSSLYSGFFRDGVISALQPLLGNISKKKPGWVHMDAEISADGETLYFVNAQFGLLPIPAKADIEIAYKKDGQFIVAPNSIVQHINTNDLEYAPSISDDGLELFFTRLIQRKELRTLKATRRNLSEPFGVPEVIKAIEGYAEAPSITTDGKTLYFHKKVGTKFSIYRVTRVP